MSGVLGCQGVNVDTWERSCQGVNVDAWERSNISNSAIDDVECSILVLSGATYYRRSYVRGDLGTGSFMDSSKYDLICSH